MDLKKINLKKCVRIAGAGFTHPEINLKKWYLAKLNNGQWAAGKFTMEWYGLNFDGFYHAGLQLDPPGENCSTWKELYEIVRRRA